MNEGFVLLDTDQNILLINASACRAFGVKKTEAQGKNILPPRATSRSSTAWRRC
ncbi:MAG: PAS domain-containing protein [Ruthenibacterium lactatiformans]